MPFAFVSGESGPQCFQSGTVPLAHRCEIPADPSKRIPFDLDRDVQGRVAETATALGPFADLVTLDHLPSTAASRVLVVTALSGQHAIILRDLTAYLFNAGLNVSVIDWANARDVPVDLGYFHFDDMVEAVLQAIQVDPRGTHLIGVCQACIPALIAAGVAAIGSDARPILSLSLLGGPIAPGASPTRLSHTLEMTPLYLLAATSLQQVSPRFRGVGRYVYPAETQLAQLEKYLARHRLEGGTVQRKLEFDDGLAPNRFPFEVMLKTLKDISAEAFIESIDQVYHRRSLAAGTARWKNIPVPLWELAFPLFTAGATEDDIVAPEQTAAAHALMPLIAADQREHLLLQGGSHFDLFHGHLCRDQVVPRLTEFVQRFGG